VIDLRENPTRSFSSSRLTDRLELKRVPWSALKPHIDVFEADGKARTGLLVSNNPVNRRDPFGLAGGVVVNEGSGTIFVYGQDAAGNPIVVELEPGESTADPNFLGSAPGKNKSDADIIIDPGEKSGFKLVDTSTVYVTDCPSGSKNVFSYDDFWLNQVVNPAKKGEKPTPEQELLKKAKALAKKIFPAYFGK